MFTAEVRTAVCAKSSEVCALLDSLFVPRCVPLSEAQLAFFPTLYFTLSGLSFPVRSHCRSSSLLSCLLLWSPHFRLCS